MFVIFTIVKSYLSGLEKKYGFRFRKIWYWKRSLGFGFRIFGLGKKVSVSVLENLVLEKKSRFRFWKNLVSEKVLVSVSEYLVSEKKSRYRFQKIWYWKKSLGIGFGGGSSKFVLQYYSFKMKIKGYFSGVFKFITIL